MKHTVFGKTNCVVDLASLERQDLKDSTKNKRSISPGGGLILKIGFCYLSAPLSQRFMCHISEERFVEG